MSGMNSGQKLESCKKLWISDLQKNVCIVSMQTNCSRYDIHFFKWIAQLKQSPSFWWIFLFLGTVLQRENLQRGGGTKLKFERSEQFVAKRVWKFNILHHSNFNQRVYWHSLLVLGTGLKWTRLARKLVNKYNWAQSGINSVYDFGSDRDKNVSKMSWNK